MNDNLSPEKDGAWLVFIWAIGIFASIAFIGMAARGKPAWAAAVWPILWAVTITKYRK